MLTWILIIVVLAFVFGVIKVETLKSWKDKAVTFIREGLDKGDSSDDSPDKKSK